MPSITIRDVPAAAHEELAARAARSGRSLQEYLRNQLIDLSNRPDADAFIARLRHDKQHDGVRLDVTQILNHRDADRP